jgi:hypothetical protein
MMMFIVSGCYEVVYTAEYKGDSCIKFEDAMYEVEPDLWVEACLGEDGAVEADGFYVELEGDPPAPEDIDVTIKAGKCKDTIEGLVWDDDYEAYIGEVCGFLVLGDTEDSEWYFAVVSDDIEGGKDGTAALSNITFCLGDAIVVGPEEGDFPTDRAEEEDISPEI